MNWEPIETAPKDGSSILGYAFGQFAVVHWYENFMWGDSYWSLDVVGTHAEDGEWTPTHWQRLPDAP